MKLILIMLMSIAINYIEDVLTAVDSNLLLLILTCIITLLRYITLYSSFAREDYWISGRGHGGRGGQAQ